MIIYMDRCTNKLTKDKSLGIPIDISTEIELPLYEITDKKDNLIINGKKIYIDNTGIDSTDSITVTRTNKKIEPLNIIGKELIDEDIFESEKSYNEPHIVNMKKYHITKVNKDNYHMFEPDDIFRQELTNILNSTNYDHIAAEFDTVSDSSFEFSNGYIMILDKSDYIHITIDDISVNEVCIGNVPDGLSIYVNTKVPALIKDGLKYFNTEGHSKIDINIINSSDKKINISNMFMMY